VVYYSILLIDRYRWMVQDAVIRPVMEIAAPAMREKSVYHSELAVDWCRR